jgi:DNA polymerase-1
MIALQQWLDANSLGTRLLLQVPDELVLEVPADELERIKIELPKLMSGVGTLDVPLVVDVGVGPNWDKAH